jgi:polysaccharide biosynthesis/export protein
MQCAAWSFASGLGGIVPFDLSQRVGKFSWFPSGLVVAIGSLLAACALPAAGPTALQLESSVGNADFPFHLVRVDGRVVSILQGYRGVTFGEGFRTGRYAASNALRPGDVVTITVYETGGSTLFPPPMSSSTFSLSPHAPNSAPAGNSTIPAQVVEADGTINVPFVGRVAVTGRTPGQVGRIIEQGLRGKAVEPQVIVSLVNNATNTATVGGDVNAPKPVPLSLRGERLLDVIASAGGAKYASYDTYVEIVRGGRTGAALLQSVVKNPSENVIIRPNDQIFLTRAPRSFAVMGATQKVAQYPFESERVTLAEAIARAGGPIDNIGDPGGIYLFRFEPWSIAKEILKANNIDLGSGPPPDVVPILYQIGLREAEGYFYAQAVQMRDKDIVLITNAEATQLQKLLVLARGVSGIAYEVQRAATLR